MYIEWQKEITPTSRSGNLGNNDFEGEGELIASGLCSEYEQTRKVYYWAAELASATDKYKLTVNDRVNKSCDESEGGGGGAGTTPPKLTNFAVTNNLPGSFKFETSNSSQIETVGASEQPQQSLTSMVENGGSIYITVPKSSISSSNGVCGGCHIAFTSDNPITVGSQGGSFSEDPDGIWWIPTLKFYNGNGNDYTETCTFLTGNNEIYVYISNGN